MKKNFSTLFDAYDFVLRLGAALAVVACPPSALWQAYQGNWLAAIFFMVFMVTLVYVVGDG